METLKFCKIRKVKSPVRAHSTDAGIDFFVPEDINVETFREKCDTTQSYPKIERDLDDNVTAITLEPGESVLIPSGIRVHVPTGYMLQFNNKSGIATKRSLVVGASVVDTGYTGECHINLHNVSNHPQTICAGDKIVQGILVHVGLSMPEELSSDEYDRLSVESDRGSGGFGSSGTV